MIGILRIKDAEGNWHSIEALRGETGPVGPKGADGTMTFADLTEEQRESLRGPRGFQGEIGPKGDSYTLTAEDKVEIGQMVLESLPKSEEVEF